MRKLLILLILATVLPGYWVSLLLISRWPAVLPWRFACAIHHVAVMVLVAELEAGDLQAAAEANAPNLAS
jgi:hypothetical protein